MNIANSQEIISPEQLFGDYMETVLNMIADHSPFPRGQTNDSRRAAKLHAAGIHLAETVYFGQIVYRALQPRKTIEVCFRVQPADADHGEAFRDPGDLCGYGR